MFLTLFYFLLSCDARKLYEIKKRQKQNTEDIRTSLTFQQSAQTYFWTSALTNSCGMGYENYAGQKSFFYKIAITIQSSNNGVCRYVLEWFGEKRDTHYVLFSPGTLGLPCTPSIFFASISNILTPLFDFLWRFEILIEREEKSWEQKF